MKITDHAIRFRMSRNIRKDSSNTYAFDEIDESELSASIKLPKSVVHAMQGLAGNELDDDTELIVEIRC